MHNQGHKSDYSHLRQSQERLDEFKQKQKVIRHASIAIRTSFIFALEVFEEEFGDLWGEYKPENQDLTTTETEFEEKYLRARNRILDNGNNNIRRFKNFLENL